MLAGATDRDKLREAARREQETIDSLLATAEAIGREHGVGQQILIRVGETFQAASSDPGVAEAIRLGRLAKEQGAASIGLVGPSAPAKPAKGKLKDRDAAESRARRQQAKRRQAAERRVHEAELDANAARRELGGI
jgi:hypothetical protein